jgi:hypothetical protein
MQPPTPCRAVQGGRRRRGQKGAASVVGAFVAWFEPSTWRVVLGGESRKRPPGRTATPAYFSRRSLKNRPGNLETQKGK